MIKKIVPIFLALALVLCLASCKSDGGESDGQIKIIASCFPAYDFARQIAGDKATVELLLSPGEASHSFELTPQDVIAISGADIFVCNGGIDEAWVDTVLSSADMSGVKVVKMLDSCDLLGEDHGGGDHGGGSHVERYDEHVWTSPRNALAISADIAKAIAECDEDNRDYYEARAASYEAELRSLDADYRSLFDENKDNIIVVADKFPFAYLAKHYGINYVAAFDDCSEDSEPSADTISHIIDVIRGRNVKYVFHIELSSGRVSSMLASDLGVGELLLHSCHNLTKNELDSGETYVSLMRQNLANLKLALGVSE